MESYKIEKEKKNREILRKIKIKIKIKNMKNLTVLNRNYPQSKLSYINYRFC